MTDTQVTWHKVAGTDELGEGRVKTVNAGPALVEIVSDPLLV